MLKKLLYLFGFIFSGLFTSVSAQAVCPICTVAVCAGVGFSRWLGIDDSITGIWIGASAVSAAMWTLDWLRKKKIDFKFRGEIIYLAFFVLVVMPLYYTDIMGHPLNTRWGIDKILLGMMFGMAAFLLGVAAHALLKRKNNGKSYFPFQKVVLPVSFLIIISLILYFLICQK